ncbi:hypothetical protein OROMI_010699 [Orobanche minor]
MAAFRLVNLPAIASRSACTHLFLPSPPPLLPPNPCLLSLTTKPQMPNLQIFLVQAHAEAQSQPVVQSEEDEFSMYNKIRNRGLSFVSMASHEEAVAALENLESTGRCLDLLMDVRDVEHNAPLGGLHDMRAARNLSNNPF